ncbi:unnamed protein product [Chrysoparadoxa australica]
MRRPLIFLAASGLLQHSAGSTAIGNPELLTGDELLNNSHSEGDVSIISWRRRWRGDGGGTTGPTLPPASDPEHGGFKYVGCFNPPVVGSALNGSPAILSALTMRDLTAENCYRECGSITTLFALQQATCLCLSHNDFAVPSNSCKTPCGGNSLEACGGPLINSLYEVVKPLESETSDFTALGCFLPPPEAWVPGTQAGYSVAYINKLTPVQCFSECAGLTPFFALKQNVCMCWASMLGAIETPDSCQNLCPGDDQALCGGVWSSSAYSVDSTAGLPPKPEPPILITPAPIPLVNSFYLYLGCFAATEDDVVDGEAVVAKSTAIRGLIPDLCHQYCGGDSPIFALEGGGTCLCLNYSDTEVDDIQCSQPCAGNGNMFCGGLGARSVYTVESLPDVTAPAPVNLSSHFQYEGCYAPDLTSIVRKGGVDATAIYTIFNITPEECFNLCGHAWGFGLQQNYCLCLGTMDNQVPSTDCTYPCSGDNSVSCGGVIANSIYSIQSGPGPQETPAPTSMEDEDRYTQLGCFNPPIIESIVTQEAAVSSAVGIKGLTPERCYHYCGAASPLFALQGGALCLCMRHNGNAIASSECRQPCTGNPDHNCGGLLANMVYEVHTEPNGFESESIPGVQVLPSEYSYEGCFKPTIKAAIQNAASAGHALIVIPGLTPDKCYEHCAASNAWGFALQHETCICFGAEPDFDESSDCDEPCSGDSDIICGGNLAHSVYSLDQGQLVPTSAPNEVPRGREQTVAPTTLAPTTIAPTTPAPTTMAPSTPAPTTMAPSTPAPTTMAPSTPAPTGDEGIEDSTDVEFSMGALTAWTCQAEAYTGSMGVLGFTQLIGNKEGVAISPEDWLEYTVVLHGGSWDVIYWILGPSQTMHLNLDIWMVIDGQGMQRCLDGERLGHMVVEDFNTGAWDNFRPYGAGALHLEGLTGTHTITLCFGPSTTPTIFGVDRIDFLHASPANLLP